MLGTLEVWTGQDWARVGAAKQRALLAALLLQPGQPVSTDTLIDEVWPDKPPARAGNVISVHIYHLRRLIGDADGQVLVTRAPGYQVVVRPGELDSDLFARRAAEGRQMLADGEPENAVTLLTEALELWRGRPLADVPSTQRFAAAADRLEEARIEARELLAEATMGCGRYGQAVPDLRSLVSEWPLRESSWALLMRALYGANRQAQALEAYEQARTKIADELGVDPSPELQQLYQQILKADGDQPVAPLLQPGAVPADVPAPAQLPADLTDFTGRAGQVAELRGLLSGAGPDGNPGAVRVALVVGAGGLGKTALSVHVAHELASEFPDGQLYVNLRGATQPADPSEVLAWFLRALGADGAHLPPMEDERAALYRTRLAGKRVLIVLDDARNAAQVRSLLPGSASCAVLVTSRNWLPELAGSAVLDLDVLSDAEAGALFTRVVGERRVVAEPAAVKGVLTVCAGLPLAIRIAGARLATRTSWSVSALAARLSDEQRRLDELRVGNLAVRTSFEVSFATLPAPARAGELDAAAAFRRLGLWTGPSIGLTAATVLIGEPEIEISGALDVLVDAHLLESPEPDRYRFHDLLRVYAAERARQEEPAQDREAAVARLLAWYVYTADAAAAIISPHHARVPLEAPPPGVRPLEFGTLEAALAWCDDERAGLVAAIRLAAAAGLHEFAWKLPAAAMSYYYRRSHWGDWVTTHQIGLASARSLADRRAEAWMLNVLGMAYGVQRKSESVDSFEQALAIYREVGDRRGEASAAGNVAQAYVELRRYDEAVQAAERSLEIQRQQGNRYFEGVALGVLGHACKELGRFGEATSYLDQALVIFRELGQQYAEADSLTDLGDTYLSLDQVGDAIANLRPALEIRRQIGDQHGEAVTLHLLGLALQRAADPQAAGLLNEAVRLFEKLGDHEQATEVRAEIA